MAKTKFLEICEHIDKEIKINIVQLCKELRTGYIVENGKFNELAQMYVDHDIFETKRVAFEELRRYIVLEAVRFVSTMDQQD